MSVIIRRLGDSTNKRIPCPCIDEARPERPTEILLVFGSTRSDSINSNALKFDCFLYKINTYAQNDVPTALIHLNTAQKLVPVSGHHTLKADKGR